MRHILFLILVLFVSITFYGIDDLIDESHVDVSTAIKEKDSPKSPFKQEEVYKTYTNGRFYFCVDYPSNFLYPQAPPDNGDGLKFLSKDGQSYMIASGIYALDETLEMDYQNSLKETDGYGVKRSITYHRLAKNYYIVSGYQEGKIYYRRSYLREGVFRTLYLMYPPSEKERFDKIIAHVIQSFPHCREE